MNRYFLLLIALVTSSSLYAGPGQYRCVNDEKGWSIEVDMNRRVAVLNNTLQLIRLKPAEPTSLGHVAFFSGWSGAMTQAFYFDLEPTLDTGTLTIQSEVTSTKQYRFICEPTDDVSGMTGLMS